MDRAKGLCLTHGPQVKKEMFDPQKGFFQGSHKEHLRYCEERAGATLLGLGLWGDGVPCNWDRTESVETLSLNLPGQKGRFQAMRLPIFALSKKQMIEETWEDVFELVAWS